MWLGIALFLTGLVAGGLLVREWMIRRRQESGAQQQRAVSKPKPKKSVQAAPVASTEKQIDRETNWDKPKPTTVGDPIAETFSLPLFDRRYARLSYLIQQPSIFRSYISDVELVEKLDNGIEESRDLFVMLEEIEERRGEQVFDTLPGAASKLFMQRHFGRRDWMWPATIQDWLNHFRNHPPLQE